MKLRNLKCRNTIFQKKFQLDRMKFHLSFLRILSGYFCFTLAFGNPRKVWKKAVLWHEYSTKISTWRAWWHSRKKWRWFQKYFQRHYLHRTIFGALYLETPSLESCILPRLFIRISQRLLDAFRKSMFDITSSTGFATHLTFSDAKLATNSLYWLAFYNFFLLLLFTYSGFSVNVNVSSLLFLQLLSRNIAIF